MKKLFDFLKSLFAKLDFFEEKIGKVVENSNFLSKEQKTKLKKGLTEFDKIEERVEKVVNDVEAKTSVKRVKYSKKQNNQ